MPYVDLDLELAFLRFEERRDVAEARERCARALACARILGEWGATQARADKLTEARTWARIAARTVLVTNAKRAWWRAEGGHR